MQWSKIKSIALLILALVNVVLLVFVCTQAFSSAQYQEEARTQAVALLEKNGIDFLPTIPDDLEGASLSVDRARLDTGEDDMATALLGEWEKTSLSEDIQLSYTSALGTANFYSSGRFTFAFEHGVYPCPQDTSYEDYAAELLNQLGCQGQWAYTTTQGEETTVAFYQLWDARPIFTCELTFTFLGDTLYSIDAQYLSGTSQTDTQEELRTTATILVQFLGGINDGTVSICTKIQEMTWGYQANLIRPTSTLSPTWYIVTDTGAYYMDCITGDIQQAT